MNSLNLFFYFPTFSLYKFLFFFWAFSFTPYGIKPNKKVWRKVNKDKNKYKKKNKNIYKTIMVLVIFTKIEEKKIKLLRNALFNPKENLSFFYS